MMDGLQASQTRQAVGKLSLISHFIYNHGSGQAIDALSLITVQRCDQLYSDRESSHDLFMQQCSSWVLMVSTEGKISLCVPIYMCVYI